jgi:hypothetical protein
MTKDQVQLGMTLRTIKDRYDAPAGTFATVETMGWATRAYNQFTLLSYPELPADRLAW